MVKRKLRDTYKPGEEESRSLSKEITDLKVVALHKNIARVCASVLSDVEKSILVYVDADVLEKRKPRKQRLVPMNYYDYEAYQSSGKIRSDWRSDRWEKNPPHGWLWYNDDPQETILGCIYQDGEKNPQVLIQREIAENPYGAIILIRAMKDKLEKIIPKRNK